MPKQSLVATHHLETHTLADLIARVWGENPKRHALVELRDSLGKFGYGQPILIDDTSGRIVEGHGVLAALLLSQEDGEKPPARVQVQGGDWTVTCVHFQLDEEQATPYSLGSSRTLELGGWDDNLLLRVLNELQDKDALGGTGFHPEDIVSLQAKVSGELPASFRELPDPQDDPTQPKSGKQVTCPHCGEVFTT